MKQILLTICIVLIGGQQVLAMPEYSVESARSCALCHEKPAGWPDPETAHRKCTYDCTACHVNPTGAGLRTAAGTFYGRLNLPMFGSRPTSLEKIVNRSAPKPNPMNNDGTEAPPPHSPERYGGLKPDPFFQVGFDLRTMGYFPQADEADSAFFPMQADLYLAVRPYNPETYMRGRLTLLVNTGFEGDRQKEYDEILDRWFVREWWLLLDDLPNQMYLKAGRFLPAYGWRLADHTSFVREPLTFNHDFQVTGLEFGLNPNYPYLSMSVFNSAREWDKPYEPDDGYGAAVSGGYRSFFWQLGGSGMYISNDTLDQYWVGLQWSANFMNAAHPWKAFNWLPLVYLGEMDVWNCAFAEEDDDIMGWAAFHQFNFYVTTGISILLRYDFQDSDLERKDDQRHRYTVGLDYSPFKHVSFLIQYRVNEEPQQFDNDEALIQMHLWY